MKDLVFIKRDEAFTNSFVIADETGNEHRAVRQLIRSYEAELKQFGTLCISNVESTGGRPEQFYDLNEMQATFLITLLKNVPKVVEFKINLVKEFYRMRQFILERQSAEWQQARITGKQVRHDETDIILTKLIPHAEAQGSQNAGKLYMSYSKLVNSVLGIEAGQRDKLSLAYIETIKFLERAIENIISIEVDKGTHYKEIYQVCKVKCQMIQELSFLPQLDRIA